VTADRKTGRPHWYKLFAGECPVCGRDKSYRVRVYGKRPADPGERVEYLDDTATYNHCLEREALR
jgi:hypothetical protein